MVECQSRKQEIAGLNPVQIFFFDCFECFSLLCLVYTYISTLTHYYQVIVEEWKQSQEAQMMTQTMGQ